MRLRHLAGLGLVAVIAASSAGSFTLTFSGGREGSQQGQALFYPMEMSFGGSVLRIVLYDVRGPDDYFYVHLQPSSGTRPATGTYPASAFGPEGFLIAAMEMKDGKPWVFSHQATGTITIEVSSERRLAGRLVLSEPGADGTRIEGTFEATPGTLADVPEEVR